MFAAYFDETGTHASSPFVAICGLVATSIEWSRLERPWARNLAVTGVAAFHAVECDEGTGKFFGISRAIRDSLVTGLSIAVAERDLDIIACGVSKRDWDIYAPQLVKERFATPYHFCFEFVLQKINAWSEAHASSEPIAIVFAEQVEYHSLAYELYRHYRYADDYPNLGSFGWGRPRCLIQLQTADLVAYETYEYMKARLNGSYEKPNATVERLLGNVLSDPSNAGFYDRENLATLAPSGGVLPKPPDSMV